MDENVYVAPADGGPAFPVLSDYAPNGQLVAGGTYGMSLRDWFAGHAQPADIEAHTDYARVGAFMRATTTREAARYRYADAMMQARKEAPR